MFFIKRKKIVIDAFTYSSVAYNLFRIDKAIKFLPDWWKTLPNRTEFEGDVGIKFPASTMKRCEGFISLYKSGFVIPLWTDLIIESFGNGEWAYEAADLKTDIRPHNPDEYGNAFDQLFHGKIISPWRLKEKSGVSFHWSEPSWNLYNVNYNIRILPGILNYKYQTATHINLFFPKQANKVNLSAGTPMVYFTALDDKEVEIKTHLVDDNEYKKIEALDKKFTFIGGYKKKINFLNKNKCPFH